MNFFFDLLFYEKDNTEKYISHSYDDKYYGEKLSKMGDEECWMDGGENLFNIRWSGKPEKVTKQSLKESKPFGYLGEEHSRLRAEACSTRFRNIQPRGQPAWPGRRG